MNFIPGVNLVFCLSALWSSAKGEQLSKPSFQGIQRIKEMNLSDITSVIMKINRPLVKVKALRGIIGDYQVHPNTVCSAGDRSCLWPSSQNNIYIPYVFQSNYKRAQRELISTALSELESLTCIRFKYRSREVTYLVFIDGIGCWSYVGPGTKTAQEISLQIPYCMDVGIIQHQLMHALGFYHESSRSDRDDYVEVKMENVEKGSEINFKVKKSNNLVTKYDYNSVLHFGRYAFSRSPGLPTIVPKLDPNVYLGQLMGLSETDILKINKLYQCKICGNLLTENYRYFTSPSFPNFYPDHANCKWMIRAPWHHKLPFNWIVLEFDFFHIQPFLGCYRDNLKIYDGSTTHSPVLKGPVCGKIAPAVISSHHLLLIAFSSGHYKHSKGFSAKYRFVNCGRMLITSPTKIIGRFEHRGSINPNESSNCFWLVQAHKGHEVVFEITTYNFQRSDNCTFAYLKIHDVSQAPPANRGKFCGATPVPLTEGTALLLEFNHPGAQMQPGLRVDYKCVIRPFERRGRSSVRWNAQCDAFMLVWCILINSAWIV
ncbi:astacin-like metalloendopeptidase isoform X2 [Hypanus sabinus]|uniref:astacin-like metalloendopeptidase isoform X2 n=1 Tax=Hypanus sabinus TaxID=79690 RepID=UPI0028C4031C|nr:astacin-like metalloendopeptidase isoform X2 [Hypanus sabinus]XP_059831399.1 astacin-like metalloendopeptidase isoform X2 [Hypanus sabinus]